MTYRPVKRKPGLTPISELLPAALEHMGLVERVANTRVRQAWERIAPPLWRRNLQFVGYEKGLLRLRASSSTWAEELRLGQTELINRLNATLGEELIHQVRTR